MTEFGEFADLVPKRRKKDFGEFADLVPEKNRFGEFADLVPDRRLASESTGEAALSGQALTGEADVNTQPMRPLEEVGKGIVDAPRAVASGTVRLGQSMTDLFVDQANKQGKTLHETMTASPLWGGLNDEQKSGLESLAQETKPPQIPAPDRPKSDVGKLIELATEYGAPFIPVAGAVSKVRGAAKGIRSLLSKGVRVAEREVPAALEEVAAIKAGKEVAPVLGKKGGGGAKVYYHGTTSAYDEILPSPGKMGVRNMYGPGIYVTDNPVVASDYAAGLFGESGGNVRPVVPLIKNPFNVDAPASSAEFTRILGVARKSDKWNEAGFRNSFKSSGIKTPGDLVSGRTNQDIYDFLEQGFDENLKAANQAIKNSGYDGIRYHGGLRKGRDLGLPEHDVLVAFDKNQVRSVFEKPPAAGITGPEELLTPAAPEFQTRAKGRQVRVAGNINLDRIDSPEAVKNALTVIGKKQGGFQEARAAGAAAGKAETLAYRELLAATTAKTMKATAKAYGGSDAEILNYVGAVEQQLGIQAYAAGKTAEASARLRAHKDIIAIRLTKEDVGGIKGKLKDLMDQYGGRDMIEKKAQIMSTIEDLEQYEKMLPEVWKPKFIDKVLEGWKAMLLSNPMTQIRNLSGNSFVFAYTVPHRLGAAAISKMLPGEKILFRESAAFTSGAVKVMRKASGEAWEVLWGKELPLGSTKVESQFRRAIGGRIGSVIRTPFRTLEAADHWFKTVNYWGEAEALALRKAVKEGLDGEGLGVRVAEILSDLDQHPEIVGLLKKRAERNTFTTPLQEQTGIIVDVADAVTRLGRMHHSVGFISPFIRTPANISKFALEGTPLGLVMSDARTAIFKTGGAARAEALSHIALGSTIMGATMSYVWDGKMTGYGPTNPTERKNWRMNNQPYSINVLGTWRDLSMIAEPFSTIIGIAADMATIWRDVPLDDYEALATSGAVATANVILNKTYMRGPSEMFKALEDPERFGDRFLETLAGSVVPSISGYAARVDDPVLREVRGVMDAVMSRIPGLRGKLQPILNMWGEEITREGSVYVRLFSPVYQMKAGQDKVAAEMGRLKMAPGMPRRQIGGVDLTPEQYVEYVRLSGKPTKVKLDSELNSPTWNAKSDAQKEAKIDLIISSYREMARLQMLRKYDDLESAVKAKMRGVK